jgi:hypothetical protein
MPINCPLASQFAKKLSYLCWNIFITYLGVIWIPIGRTPTDRKETGTGVEDKKTVKENEREDVRGYFGKAQGMTSLINKGITPHEDG